jgi:hypothetical protein
MQVGSELSGGLGVHLALPFQCLNATNAAHPTSTTNQVRVTLG